MDDYVGGPGSSLRPAGPRQRALPFNQRRKTLRNALAARWGREKAEEVLRRAGVDGGGGRRRWD